MQKLERFIDRFITSGEKYKRIDWLLKNDFKAIKSMSGYELVFSIESDDAIADIKGFSGALKDLESSLDFLKDEIKISETPRELKKLRDKVRTKHQGLVKLLEKRWQEIDSGDVNDKANSKVVSRINPLNKFDAELTEYVKQNPDIDINKLFHIFRRLKGATFETFESESRESSPELKVADALRQLFLNCYEVTEFELNHENRDKDYVGLTYVNEYGEIGKFKQLKRGTLRRKLSEIKKALKTN